MSNKIEFSQNDGPASASLKVNGVDVTSWCSAVSVKSDVCELPKATLDLVACWPIDLTVMGSVNPVFYVPAGHKLVQTTKTVDGHTETHYRAVPLEGGAVDTVDVTTLGRRFRESIPQPGVVRKSERLDWERDGEDEE